MRHSLSHERNPKAFDLSRQFQREDNLAFFAEVGRALSREEHRGVAAVGLAGRRTSVGFAIRQAQTIQRWDRRPSYWSHAFLNAGPLRGDPQEVGGVPMWECTLEPPDPLQHLPERNGVGEGMLSQYQDPRVTPNVAVIAFQLTAPDARKVIERGSEPNLDRLRFDLWSLLGVWHEYVWGLGQRPNPLANNNRLFSSAYVEMAYEAINLDLTPGASERNSSPECIWQGALWWWPQYQATNRAVQVWSCIRDPNPTLMDAENPRLNLRLPRGFGRERR